MNDRDEFARVTDAFTEKLSSRNCPVCVRGVFEPLRARFLVSPQDAPGVEPIQAIGQVCTRCGFLALHSAKHLLDDDHQ